ncbi:MAG: class I SAM-dependent methyltransferase [Bacteroidetes bacterium]|nr:class I SAM-dependent methyltransferase [Bacteroidota bacterium]MDA1121533.1 class I SAM-dependent methyltransferase [Bacteroidota bacterium]
MDIFTSLNEQTTYSSTQLQLILAAWVLTSPFDKSNKVSLETGDVVEDDYDKRSIYALLYSIYRTVGQVKDEHGELYEFTFNTWGYSWPSAWGESPINASEPQKFGQTAYSGLFHFSDLKSYINERDGKVKIVEMGCGTGAGANHICHNILPNCTYQPVDMQSAAIESCQRMFAPALDGRLAPLHADCTKLPMDDESIDIVVVNETHVTEMPGVCGTEDQEFFNSARRILKKGGYLTWGNAIPDATWQPCFDYLKSIGMRKVEECDVTKEAIKAREDDLPRVNIYSDHVLDKFWGFSIPIWGKKRRKEAELALKNFYRHPGTNLYNDMVDGTDSYKVVLFQKL